MFNHISKITLIISLSFFVNKIENTEPCQKPSIGTTKNIESIFKGRCSYFINVKQAFNCDFDPSSYDCDVIWESFRSILTTKAPCDIKMEDLDEFLKLVNHNIAPNTSVFWSGTYALAHDYTRTNQFWTLEDTFSGYLLNELKFCANNTLDGFDYDSCPDDCVTRNSMLWNAASADFAKKASGSVTLILNGTRSVGSIANYSTFYKYELPRFSSDRIQHVKVILLHSPGQEIYESCARSRNLVMLKNLLEQKSIDYACEDDPADIVLLMCYQDTSRNCKEIKNILKDL